MVQEAMRDAIYPRKLINRRDLFATVRTATASKI
jgi:hypothetical protein